MRVVSLTCNHCGAPLEVPAKTKFLTCEYCNARLSVQRSGNAVFTEVLEALDERTERIAKDVEVIKVQNKLEQLDREWMDDRQRYMMRGKHRHYRVPSAAGSVVGGVIAVLFGIFWTVTASSAGAPGPFVLFGVVFIGAALIGVVVSVGRASQYERRKQEHEHRRHEVLQELRDLQRQRNSNDRDRF